MDRLRVGREGNCQSNSVPEKTRLKASLLFIARLPNPELF